MWFRPGMCVVRCNHTHLDYTFVCIITYLEGHSVLPLLSQTQSFLEMTWSALPMWQRSFKQRPVHSEAQSALIHPPHKPCLCSLSLTFTFFIYLSPSLLSNRTAMWSTAAVSQPAAVLMRDGRTDDAVRLQTRWGTEAIQVWKPPFSVKVRSQRSGARCDLEQQFMGPYYLWELLICRHLKCCETELFHTLPLLLCPSSLPHSSLLVCEAWDIWSISWSAATHKAGLSSWSEWVLTHFLCLVLSGWEPCHSTGNRMRKTKMQREYKSAWQSVGV